MANTIHHKYRTYLTYKVCRGFQLILEPQINITLFIAYIHDNKSSDSPILTDQLTYKINSLRRVIFEAAAIPHLSQKLSCGL